MLRFQVESEKGEYENLTRLVPGDPECGFKKN